MAAISSLGLGEEFFTPLTAKNSIANNEMVPIYVIEARRGEDKLKLPLFTRKLRYPQPPTEPRTLYEARTLKGLRDYTIVGIALAPHREFLGVRLKDNDQLELKACDIDQCLRENLGWFQGLPPKERRYFIDHCADLNRRIAASLKNHKLGNPEVVRAYREEFGRRVLRDELVISTLTDTLRDRRNSDWEKVAQMVERVTGETIFMVDFEKLEASSPKAPARAAEPIPAAAVEVQEPPLIGAGRELQREHVLPFSNELLRKASLSAEDEEARAALMEAMERELPLPPSQVIPQAPALPPVDPELIAATYLPEDHPWREPVRNPYTGEPILFPLKEIEEGL